MAKDRRLKLHEELVEILGSRNVYFQPPESVKMKYPCIVYNRNSGDTLYANNMPYRFTQSYTITYIDPKPDSTVIRDLALAFPMIRFDRHYTADNLNHDTFILYYEVDESGNEHYIPYEGPYIVTPKAWLEQVLDTKDKMMTDDVTVLEVPYVEVSNLFGTTVTIATD